MDSFDTVVKKVVEVFSSNEDAVLVSRILQALTHEMHEYQDFCRWPVVCRVLELAVGSPTFKTYATSLAEQTTKTEAANAEYLRFMESVAAHLLDITEYPTNPRHLLLVKDYVGSPSIRRCLLQALQELLPQLDEQIVPAVWALEPVSGSPGLATLEQSLTGSSNGAMTTGVPLADVLLNVEAIQSIHKWYTGAISGLICSMMIAHSAGFPAGSLAGGAGGAAAFACMLAGGLDPFGILASAVGRAACNVTMLKIFDVPRDVAVENAYRFFGVDHKAPNDSLNSAYRLLCLQRCQDKGGIPDAIRGGGVPGKFLEVQVQFAIIKKARGELENDPSV